MHYGASKYNESVIRNSFWSAKQGSNPPKFILNPSGVRKVSNDTKNGRFEELCRIMQKRFCVIVRP